METPPHDVITCTSTMFYLSHEWQRMTLIMRGISGPYTC